MLLWPLLTVTVTLASALWPLRARGGARSQWWVSGRLGRPSSNHPETTRSVASRSKPCDDLVTLSDGRDGGEQGLVGEGTSSATWRHSWLRKLSVVPGQQDLPEVVTAVRSQICDSFFALMVQCGVHLSCFDLLVERCSRCWWSCC